MAEQTSAADAPMTRESLMNWDNIEEVTDAPQPDAKLSPDGADDDGLQDVADEQPEDDVESEDQPTDESADAMRLYEFAKRAGWKLDEFYDGVTIPVNGEEVKIGEAINSIDQHSSQVNSLSQERDALQERLNQTATQGPAAMPPIDPEAQKAALLAELYQDQLADPNAWQGVDPGVASQQQIQLMNMVQKLTREAQTKQAEHQQKLSQSYQEARDEADRQVRGIIKEWADPKVRARDEQANRDFVREFGYKAEEYDAVIDPRMKHLVQAARLSMGKVKKVESKAREIRKVPKTLAPGARATLNEKTDLKTVKQRIGEAKTRDERQKLRLTMPLS